MRAMVVVLSMSRSCHGDGTAPPDVTSGGRADQSVATGGSDGSRFRKRRTGSGGVGASAAPGQGRFSGPEGWGDALMRVPSGRGAACVSGGSRVSTGASAVMGPRSPDPGEKVPVGWARSPGWPGPRRAAAALPLVAAGTAVLLVAGLLIESL